MGPEREIHRNFWGKPSFLIGPLDWAVYTFRLLAVVGEGQNSKETPDGLWKLSATREVGRESFRRTFNLLNW